MHENAGDPPFRRARAADGALETTVDALMDGVCADLKRLAAIPSIAFPGFSPEPVLQARDLLVALLRDAGVADIGELNLPGTAPVITGSLPPPTPEAPTVLLYGHYDVQPPGEERLWDSPPFEPTDIEGGIRARGIADDKANLMVHIGALRAYGGRPPVGIRIVFEGQEEYGSAFDDYPPTEPDLFACDAMIIADTGNIRPGTPTLTTALRGSAVVFAEVRTLRAAVHSGAYGGAAPDALLVLLKALATLHDVHGDVAVEGLHREPWDGSAFTDDEFREVAGVPHGTPLLGSGGLGERLWSGPAVTVIGLDAPPVDRAAAAVGPVRPRQAEPPGPPPAGPTRGAGRPHPPSATAAPVRHPAHRHSGRRGTRLRSRRRRTRLPRRPHRPAPRLGHRPRTRRVRRIRAAGQRPGQGRTGRRDPALRRRGQPLRSARPQRTGAGVRTARRPARRGRLHGRVRSDSPCEELR
ncbi:Peptidase dimerisation domain-containing protein [Streptomyces sp. 2323.1]|nr:Peptidase dimerisation domain-containing protein [Streptomyces sp. 2323.1]